jgi:hypothetical protein
MGDLPNYEKYKDFSGLSNSHRRLAQVKNTKISQK